MTFVLFVHRHQRKTDMDPYERLVAINEALNGEKPESETTEETPETIRKKIVKAANTTEDPNKVAARLKAYYARKDKLFGDSAFGGSIVGESTEAERIDQAGARGKQALEDAGIKFKFRGGIGSMNREDNHYIVSPKDVKAAKRALKGVSNAQVKTK